MSNGVPLTRQRLPYKLLLRHHLALGDVLCSTVVVECLKRQFPNKYRVSVETTAPDIWLNNPHVERLVPGECHIVEMEYPLIAQANEQPFHFLEAFTTDLAHKLGIPLTLDTNRPALYLSEAEKSRPPLEISGKYALLNAGGKCDFTVKMAGTKIFQEIVDAFPQIQFLQVGAKEHLHPKLSGVVDVIGKTSVRELICLAYHSEFGLGAESFLHHVYAAIQKPYICYLGGRLPLSWIAYPTAIMLQTLGSLPCCARGGCFKRRTVALHDGHPFDRDVCALPLLESTTGEHVPACLEMLGSEAGIKAIENLLSTGMIDFPSGGQ